MMCVACGGDVEPWAKPNTEPKNPRTMSYYLRDAALCAACQKAHTVEWTPPADKEAA